MRCSDLVKQGTIGRAICVGVHSDDGPPAIEEEADLVVDGTEGVRELLAALVAD